MMQEREKYQREKEQEQRRLGAGETRREKQAKRKKWKKRSSPDGAEGTWNAVFACTSNWISYL